MRGAVPRGVTLIEFLLALLVWGLVLAGLLPAVWRSVRDSYTLGESVVARTLADEIQEEIAALPRKGSNLEDTPASACPACLLTGRSAFTSPLDYDNLVETHPLSPLGHELPGVSHFARRVNVEYVDAENLLPVADGQSELVHVTVEVIKGGETLRTLSFLRSLR